MICHWKIWLFTPFFPNGHYPILDPQPTNYISQSFSQKIILIPFGSIIFPTNASLGMDMLTLISKSYAVVPITTIFPEVPWDIIFTISFSDISICSWNICWTTLGVLNNIIFAPLFCTFVLFTAESIFDAAPLSSVSTHIFPSTIPGRCDSICTHIAISSSRLP